MSTILEFLRKDFSVLEELPKDDVDNLIDRVKLYRLNPNRRENSTEVNQLLADVGYYHYQIGKKLAQVQAIRDRIQLQVDYILANTKVKGELKDELKYTNANKHLFEVEASKNPNYQLLKQQLIDCDSIYMYLENSHKSLFMEHYALRNQNQPTNNMHYTINH